MRNVQLKKETLKESRGRYIILAVTDEDIILQTHKEGEVAKYWKKSDIIILEKYGHDMLRRWRIDLLKELKASKKEP